MMLEVYKLSIDREIPERSRILTREILRKKFMLASSDEEGGLSSSRPRGAASSISPTAASTPTRRRFLCGKSMYTTMFVQNFARWSATPAAAPEPSPEALVRPEAIRAYGRCS